MIKRANRTMNEELLKHLENAEERITSRYRVDFGLICHVIITSVIVTDVVVADCVTRRWKKD